MYRALNLRPFTLYHEAWYKFEAGLWRNLAFNILMFVPFGVLLPLLTKKCQKARVTVTAALGFSILIEAAQYAFRAGQAEFDDILNNTAGAWIGYGLVMAVLTVARRQPKRRLFGYIAPLFVAGAAFGIIFTVYGLKDCGTISEAYYPYRQELRGAEIKGGAELSENGLNGYVYAVGNTDAPEARAFAEEFFGRINASFSPNRDSIYYDSFSMFYSHNGSLIVRYKGSSYEYTNFSSNEEPENSATEDQVRALLAAWQIDIPGNAVFTNHGSGEYSFHIPFNTNKQSHVGRLTCTVGADGTIWRLSNYLHECPDAIPYKLISPREAFRRFEKGEFYWYGENGGIQSLEYVFSELEYRADTKGYYQPVYIFIVLINGERYEIVIPAVT